MTQQDIDPQLYSDFGVYEYVKKLEKELSIEGINQLHKILAEYIVTQALNDLSKEAIEELESLDFKNSRELFSFLNKHINNLSVKIKEYGQRFRKEYPNIRNPK